MHRVASHSVAQHRREYNTDTLAWKVVGRLRCLRGRLSRERWSSAERDRRSEEWVEEVRKGAHAQRVSTVDSRGKGAFSDPEGLWTSQQEERQGCKRGREKDEKWPDGLGPKTWLVTVRPTITGRELRNTQGGIFDFDRFLKQPRYHVTYYRYKTNPLNMDHHRAKQSSSSLKMDG